MPALKRSGAKEPAPAAKKRKTVAGCQVIQPEAAGLSRAPLEKLRATVRKEVHELGSSNGVAHLILANGKCVFQYADGFSNREKKVKFGLRTICALHSCSKPLTVAAFLTLVDEGKVRLSDYVDKYLPDYSRRVVAGKSAAKTKAATTRPTLRHLCSMEGGLKHSDNPGYKDLVAQLRKHSIKDLAGFCDGLMKLPLESDPGSMHYYSLCIDVLGRVCEVVSGQKLDKFMAERLFKPLGMVDTYFVVPEAKQRRVAAFYDCRRVRMKDRKANNNMPFRAHPWKGPKMAPGVCSGGGGILSYADAGIYGSAEDYARFCQMLLKGGVTATGSRVLRESTVRLFWQDCLTPFANNQGLVRGWNDYGGSDPKEKFYWAHHAWSLLNATLDLEEPPKKSGSPRIGHTLWMYGMGAYWFIDARRKLVAVSFASCFSSGPDKGSDCVPFLKAAFDEGPAGAKLKLRKPEIFYGKEPDPSWTDLVGKK